MKTIGPLAADPVTCDRMRTGRPAGWRQRWLYVRPGGADAWIGLARSLDYRRRTGPLEQALFAEPRRRARQVGETTLRAVEGLSSRAFVSLGPGDAQLDLEIARRLARRNPELDYIPVDLSEDLLLRAAERLRPIAGVPVRILVDFEEGHAYLVDRLRRYAATPRLFGLLGNTLGNLDLGEQAFFDGLRPALGPGTQLLISVATKGKRWTCEGEPLLSASAYSPALRRFLEPELATWGPEAQADLATRLRVEPDSGDVPDTSAVGITERSSGRTLISIRRYTWVPLLAWLRDVAELQVVFESSLQFSDFEGFGVALLRAAG